MLEVSEAVAAFKQSVCWVVRQHYTCFKVTTERNRLELSGSEQGSVADFVSSVLDLWTRYWISGGLCEYSTGLCEHDTGSVAAFVNMVLDQWRSLWIQYWTSWTWYWISGGLWKQWWISGKVCENSTGSVSDFVNPILYQWRNMWTRN